MSFGDIFDGYCVLHAPFATSERRPWFEAQLRQAGVVRYQVVEARPISDDDPRLPQFAGLKGVISCLDACLAAIQLAEDQGWQHVVIFEDDVIFRSDFTPLWAEVEDEVKKFDWDVLYPYRWPVKSPLLREGHGRTKLVPMEDSIKGHCMIFRASSYDKIRDTWEFFLRRGWPADFWYGYVRSKYEMRLMATSKNLVGQGGGFKSTLQNGFINKSRFYSCFRATRNPLEHALVSTVFRSVDLCKRISRRQRA